jgi:alpha-L-fucosidase
MHRAYAVVVALLSAMAINTASLGQRPVPSPAQLEWQKMETYAFVHFGPNTFSGQEWGNGKEKPETFNPTQLNCDQWVKTFKKAGMKGVIITAKHHDGFCLWPSKLSTHTVAQSPFKRDILKELSIACKKEGLKMGVYLSPWDRNHPTYGTDSYNDTFDGMLHEVLSNYGPIFEVWFDGANGEGPNGKRQVYDWKRYIATVRKLQPNAVIFSDAGPDVRWVGNESGIAPDTSWSTINRDRYVPGTSLSKELGEGDEHGVNWVPSESDVSIRPGWFWRKTEDAKVKTPAQLEELYYKSVGHNSSFLLNVPPNDKGLISDADIKALDGFHDRISKTFLNNLVLKDENSTSDFPYLLHTPTTFDTIELGEDISKGQSVAEFTVEAEINGKMTAIASGTTIGYKKLIRLNPVTTKTIEIKITKRQGDVKITTFGLYASPTMGKDFTHETKEQKDIRMAWWRESRFGMFIHWGLYSVPAGTWKGKIYPGAAEWLMYSAQIPVKDYEPLQQQFNPVNFDAKKIVGTAKAAGMKYIVITSKHHEGFAMYPSDEGTWNIGHTQFKRDPLKELSDECKRQGIKFCTYHSIMDWHHPDFIPKEKFDKRDVSHADYERYDKVMKAQLKEIITRYDPAVMWFDGEWQSSWNHQRGVELYNYCRSLKPDIIINNRVDNARAGMSGMSNSASAVGDFGTPEQEIPANGIKDDWESCMTMNGSWGYHANDNNWKSADTLIFNAVDCASKGGNYLLNVGPTALGEIPAPSIERLAAVGRWFDRNGEAVYGTQASPFPKPMPWGRVTRKGKTLYCVVFKNDENLPILTGLKTPIAAASILGFRERISIVQTSTGPAPELPNTKRTEPIVIKVTLAGEPEIETLLPTQDASGAITFNAADAKCTGAAHFEDSKKAIGYWTETTDTVTWNFNASKPGTYRLTADVACQDDSAGSLVSATLENQERQLSIKGTGGWDKFVTIDFGDITVSKTGNTKITVKARMKPGYAVMNLQSLHLIPNAR